MRRPAPLPMPRPAALLAAALVGCAAAPARAADDRPDYYGAEGTDVTAAWRVPWWPRPADRIAVPEDGALTVQLVIRGATNPHEICRPDLNALPDFKAAFAFIEDVPGPAALPTAKKVTFTYHLRPRNSRVRRLPPLVFVFRDGSLYQEEVAAGVDLVVTPAPRPPPIPLGEVPPELLKLRTGPPLLDREPFAPGVAAWVLLAAGGPLLGLAWFVVWRRVYPDAARLARLRHRRAARRAIDAVRRAKDAAAVTAAVLGYLRTRFPLPPGAATPPDVETTLRDAGATEADTAAAVDLLRRADAARFAPPADPRAPLAADAEALIARLEGS